MVRGVGGWLCSLCSTTLTQQEVLVLGFWFCDTYACILAAQVIPQTDIDLRQNRSVVTLAQHVTLPVLLLTDSLAAPYYGISFLLLQGSYATLGMATTTTHWRNFAILALLGLIAFTVNTTSKKVTTSKTDRRRAAALKELEQEQ